MMAARRLRRTAHGFTLIEVLIVVSVLGLVMTALAAAAIVIGRVAPSNEFRVDDARSTRGLQTWLAQDVSSTPTFLPVDSTYGGFNFAPGADPCGAGAGVNVVELRWKEHVGSGTQEWIVNYRLEPQSSGTGYEVARHTCGAFGSVRLRLTSAVLNNSPCGAPSASNSGYAKATLTGGRVSNLRVCMTVNSKGGAETITLDIAPRNPSEAF
jgi:prepilin-type N-terminal cleavage/methylation domain-containing protein